MSRDINYKTNARHIIFNVYREVNAELQAGKLLTDLDDVYGRTAKSTGVSVSTVRRIVDEGIKNRGKFITPGKHKQGRPRKQIDDFNISAIRQKVQYFYTVQKEVPTLRKLLEMVKKDLNFGGSHELLRQTLLSIGFKFKKCQPSKMVLIEKPAIASKRELYLSKILENRRLSKKHQKNIIFLDEGYINESYKITKCWQSIDVSGDKDLSKEKRCIIMLAGSEKGLVRNALLIFSEKDERDDYHSVMDAHNFTKWVTEKLIPNLTKPSIIVMDNAPYHCIVTNKAPTPASAVDEIKLWLKENNISFDETLSKSSLLILVKKHKPEPVYHIDELLGEHGHDVIRLPPYHCDLSPIELIWALVKKQITSKHVCGQDVVELTKKAFQSITAKEWKKSFDHIVNIENEYYSRGETLYNDIDQLVITIDEDTSSESEEGEMI